MCTVSIVEFNRNPAKYFQIAKTENVLIVDNDQTYELIKKEVFISGEELKKRVHAHIDDLFAGKK